MGTAFRLQLCRRIPPGIDDEYIIGIRQVQTDSTCFQGNEKGRNIRPGRKAGDLPFPVDRTAGKHCIWPVMFRKCLRQQIQVRDKRGEDQYLMSFADQCLKSIQHLLYLSRTTRIIRHHHPGMICQLTQTGNPVQSDKCILIAFLQDRISQRILFFLVDFPLFRCHFTEYHLFRQWRKFGRYLLFGSPQEERTDNLLQSFRSFLISLFRDRLNKIFPETIRRSQQAGIDKIKLRP